VYDHNVEDAVSEQEGLPEELRGTVFYEPTKRGYEETLTNRVSEINRKKRDRGKEDRRPPRPSGEE